VAEKKKAEKVKYSPSQNTLPQKQKKEQRKGGHRERFAKRRGKTRKAKKQFSCPAEGKRGEKKRGGGRGVSDKRTMLAEKRGYAREWKNAY